MARLAGGRDMNERQLGPRRMNVGRTLWVAGTIISFLLALVAIHPEPIPHPTGARFTFTRWDGGTAATIAGPLVVVACVGAATSVVGLMLSTTSGWRLGLGLSGAVLLLVVNATVIGVSAAISRGPAGAAWTLAKEASDSGCQVTVSVVSDRYAGSSGRVYVVTRPLGLIWATDTTWHSPDQDVVPDIAVTWDDATGAVTLAARDAELDTAGSLEVHCP